MEHIKKGKKRKGCLIALIPIAVIFIILIIMFVIMSRSVKNYDDFDYSKLDLSKVEDGTYTGSEDGGMVKVTVDVTVKNHAITNVKIVKHDCGKGKPAEVIVNDIVDKNSLDVDAVSGATLSSNVIKVAIFKALTQK